VRQIVSLLPLMLVCACARAPENSWESLGRHLTAGAEALAEYPDEQGGAFELFLRAAATSAARGGDADLAAALGSLESGRAPAADQRPLASRVLRRYVVARYGERMAADLSEMVRFRTFHVEGRDNWDAPEFVRQREWLERKARQAGLEFRSYDGRVEEITLDGSGRVLGILTHGDVQGVEGQTWSAPPWEGRIENDRIVGRGAEDDKGPIVTTLYVFAAFADSGWLDGVSLRLIVSNGEECCWTEIPYYLERADPPDVTIGFDASYPVTHAQKAWSVMTVTAPRSESRNEPASGWRIVSLEGGSGLSIIPERGELVLQPLESALAAELAERAATWAAAHPPARLEVTTEGELVRLTATGRGGHSSEPEGGHNALGDLAAFVFDSETELHPADRGALVRCMGRIIGTETHGERLGISHTDPVMGSLTVNLALFDEEEGRPRARASMRVPRGIESDAIEAAIDKAVGECVQTLGQPLEPSFRMASPPHFVSPEEPLVRTLLDVWEEVTGEPGRPVAIGGGTQARLFPDGVDFGPARAMERYRGHGPDEYITVDEMQRNAELTIAALWALAGQGD
jgi:dipeptidase D